MFCRHVFETLHGKKGCHESLELISESIWHLIGQPTLYTGWYSTKYAKQNSHTALAGEVVENRFKVSLFQPFVKSLSKFGMPGTICPFSCILQKGFGLLANFLQVFGSQRCKSLPKPEWPGCKV